MTTNKLMRNKFGSVVGSDELTFRLTGILPCRSSEAEDNTDEMIKRYNQHDYLHAQNDRMKVLLIAAKEIIEQSSDAKFMTTNYDDTECDGYCLIDDINDVVGDVIGDTIK